MARPTGIKAFMIGSKAFIAIAMYSSVSMLYRLFGNEWESYQEFTYALTNDITYFRIKSSSYIAMVRQKRSSFEASGSVDIFRYSHEHEYFILETSSLTSSAVELKQFAGKLFNYIVIGTRDKGMVLYKFIPKMPLDETLIIPQRSMESFAIMWINNEPYFAIGSILRGSTSTSNDTRPRIIKAKMQGMFLRLRPNYPTWLIKHCFRPRPPVLV